MYKQTLPVFPNTEPTAVIRLTDMAIIPFDPANTDYIRFKSDVSTGTELQDPDGNIMTPEQVSDFLKTIP